MLAFSLSFSFSVESMNTWWPPLEDVLGDDDDGRDGGEAKREPAKEAAPESRKQNLCAINVLPPQIESTLQTDMESGRDYAGENLGCDLRDVEPPPSLLVEPRIRTLLFIEGIFSVCFVLLVEMSSRGSDFLSVTGVLAVRGARVKAFWPQGFGVQSHRS